MWGWGALLLAVAWGYVVAAPFTKVEESFHLQATHDMLVHGVADIDEYDHHTFPGVVPRTFLAAGVLAAVSTPAAAVVRAIGAPKLMLQVAVRCALAGGVVLALTRVLVGVARRFGAATGAWMAVAVAVTPHFLFYAGRTLPNTFATLLVLVAMRAWLDAGGPRRPDGSQPSLTTAVAALVCAIVWVRCDMLVLLAPVGVAWLVMARASVGRLVLLGVCCGAVALAATVAVDSYFWRRWLWPEGVVLWFNAVDNRSHEYGVSPWHWYATSALPRALVATAAFIPLGLLTRRPAPGSPAPRFARLDAGIAEFVLPALAFVALYSRLPHKELRFLLPGLPLLYLGAGAGLAKAAGAASYLLTHARRGGAWRCNALAGGLALAGVVGAALVASVGATTLFTVAAMHNYPGGVALQRLHSLYADDLRAAVAAVPTRASLETSAPKYHIAVMPPSPPGRRVLALPPCAAGDVETSSLHAPLLVVGLLESWRSCVATSFAACDSPIDAAIRVAAPGACASSPPLARQTVHIDVKAAQTGVSRFGEAWAAGLSWHYSKAENLTAAADYAPFDFLLTETPAAHAALFDVQDAVPAFTSFSYATASLQFAPAVYIMRRKPAAPA